MKKDELIRIYETGLISKIDDLDTFLDLNNEEVNFILNHENNIEVAYELIKQKITDKSIIELAMKIKNLDILKEFIDLANDKEFAKHECYMFALQFMSEITDADIFMVFKSFARNPNLLAKPENYKVAFNCAKPIKNCLF